MSTPNPIDNKKTQTSGFMFGPACPMAKAVYSELERTVIRAVSDSFWNKLKQARGLLSKDAAQVFKFLRLRYKDPRKRAEVTAAGIPFKQHTPEQSKASGYTPPMP